MPGSHTLTARPKTAAEEAEAAAIDNGPSPPPSGKGQNLQDMFLNHLRKTKAPVTMFLVKGVKLQGIVTWFDNFSILLRRDGQSQLVYKHAISTIMPSQPLALTPFAVAEANGRKPRLLQDIFLTSVRDAEVPVSDGHVVAAFWRGARLIEVDVGGHRRMLKSPEVIDAVTRFVTGFDRP